MRNRKAVLYLLLIMATVAAVVAGIAIRVLYDTAFEEERARLVETAQSQARLIEAVARFDAAHSAHDHPEGSCGATLSQLVDAHAHYEGFGRTGEFTLARRDGPDVVFLLSHRHGDTGSPKPVPFDSGLAEPMRRSLSNLSGTVVGPDYRGVTVLAAHEPVHEPAADLDWGIVAKIDLAEIKAPFVRAGVITGFAGLIVVAFGAVLFVRVSNPLIRRLEESEARTRAIVDTTADGIVTINERGTIDSVNRAAERIFGVAGQEVGGQNIALLIPPFDEEERDDSLAVYLDGDRDELDSLVRESIGRRKDGTDFPMDLAISRGYQADQRMYVATVRDITKRKRAEEALRQAHDELEQRVAERTAELTEANEHLKHEIAERERAEVELRQSREFLQSVINATPDPLLVIDRDYHLVLANRACEEMSGAKVTYPSSHACYQVSHRRDAPCIGLDHPCPLEDVVAAKAPLTVTHTHFDAEGNEVIVEVNAAPIVDEAGDVVQVIELCRDITARVRAEERVRQHQVELAHVARLGTIGEMATGLAHELNQPLAAIVNYLQACTERIRAGSGDARELLVDMNRASAQAERAGEIIEHIRDYVRKREPQRTSVDLNNLVREAADLVASELRRNGIGLRLDLAENLPAVKVQAIQIEQVIVNLMRNGLEAMCENGDAPGQLFVSTSLAEDDTVVLRVRDTGRGLSGEILSRAFEPFFTTRPDGMGMGLAICRTIIEAHRGRLWATSRPENGATFCFTLPTNGGDRPDES